MYMRRVSGSSPKVQMPGNGNGNGNGNGIANGNNRLKALNEWPCDPRMPTVRDIPSVT
jgi:hypothetical protein